MASTEAVPVGDGGGIDATGVSRERRGRQQDKGRAHSLKMRKRNERWCHG